MCRFSFPLGVCKESYVVVCFIAVLLCGSIPCAWSAPPVPPPSPAGGNYLALDGKNDYAILDYDTYGMLFEAGTEELTVEAWVYPDGEPDEDEEVAILHQQVAVWAVSSDNPDRADTKERLKKTHGLEKGDLIVAMQAYKTDAANRTGSTGFTWLVLSPYQWHHIAFQARDGQIAWICDNSSNSVAWGMRAVGASGITDDLSWYVSTGLIPHQSFVIGGYGGGLGDMGSFAGYIDEVRISTVARYDISREDFTPEERFEPDDDTIALWHFDERSRAEVFSDSSGNEYHLVGMNGAAGRGSLDVDKRNKLATTWANIKVGRH